MREVPQAGWVAAVDLGGSIIKGTVSAAGRLDTPVERAPRTTDPVRDLLGALSGLRRTAESAGRPVLAAGVAVPGIVDETAGYLRQAANLGLHDLDLRALLERELDVPVFIGHDIRCAALAEQRVNEASFGQITLVVPIGTGIGAAIVADGRPLVAGGYAGEIGHIDVGSGRRCACGLDGCLETVSSARAVSEIYAELSGEAGVAATAVAARASTANRAAVQAWNGAVEGLAAALAACCSVLGVDSVIVAGGLSMAGPALIDPLTAALYRRLSFHRRPRLSTAKLTADAGCRGAALGALSLLRDQAGDGGSRPPGGPG